jgi:hypothetical protein
VQELEDKIARAQVIDTTKMSGDTVKFGATVTVVDEDTDQESTYKIVGDDEADVKAGKISLSSPIARSLINKEVGDVVEVNAPGGTKSYEILNVEWKYRLRAGRREGGPRPSQGSNRRPVCLCPGSARRSRPVRPDHRPAP